VEKRRSVGVVRHVSPGPGTYAIPSRAAEGPKYSLYSRSQSTRRADNSPGPGQYEASNLDSTAERSPRYRLGRESRQRHNSTSTYVPGPGQYDVRSKLAGKLYGFGTSKREKPSKPEHPGFVYDLPSTFPKDGLTAKPN
jgi:hypothetical protein